MRYVTRACPDLACGHSGSDGFSSGPERREEMQWHPGEARQRRIGTKPAQACDGQLRDGPLGSRPSPSSSPRMEHEPPYPFASTSSVARAYVYVLPCAGEDWLKLGFSRDPLTRLQTLHRRYYEFFDTELAFAIETETVREARALEKRHGQRCDRVVSRRVCEPGGERRGTAAAGLSAAPSAARLDPRTPDRRRGTAVCLDRAARSAGARRARRRQSRERGPAPRRRRARRVSRRRHRPGALAAHVGAGLA